jgi:hypothetical protein
VWANFAKGAIAARRGEPGKGIAIMQTAIDMAGGMGSRLLRPVQLATLAMAHAKTGEIEQCLRLSTQIPLLVREIVATGCCAQAVAPQGGPASSIPQILRRAKRRRARRSLAENRERTPAAVQGFCSHRCSTSNVQNSAHF